MSERPLRFITHDPPTVGARRRLWVWVSRRGTAFVLLTLGVASAGCGDKQNPAPGGAVCAAPSAVTYDRNAREVLARNCLGCHSSAAANRHGAPAAVNFDTYAAAAASAERANTLVQAGSMPPASTGRVVSGEDRCVLSAWVVQGTPEK